MFLTRAFFCLFLASLAEAVEKGLFRPLARPQLNLCQNRGQDFSFGGHKYLFSWQQEDAGLKDWLDARNYCRERCMDALAIETAEEWRNLNAAILRSPNLPKKSGKIEKEDEALSIWTSGRLCDFDGCEKTEYVKPVHVKGWFWSANNKKMAATTCVSGRGGCFHGWSNHGKFGFPQPDNREFREEGLQGNENCLAILNDAYKGEGLKWHDKGCYRRMEYVCEDSETMLNFARKNWRGSRIP